MVCVQDSQGRKLASLASLRPEPDPGLDPTLDDQGLIIQPTSCHVPVYPESWVTVRLTEHRRNGSIITKDQVNRREYDRILFLSNPSTTSTMCFERPDTPPPKYHAWLKPSTQRMPDGEYQIIFRYRSAPVVVVPNDARTRLSQP